MTFNYILLNYKKKKFNLKVRKLKFFGRFIGLMFSKKKNAEALLFDFEKPVNTAIHSWFVFFPFIAVWIDDKNKIFEVKLVKPFFLPISPKRKFVKLVEIPVNKRHNSILKLFFSNLLGKSR
jgi:uncharacterized membrane protein (UPF0127 family)